VAQKLKLQLELQSFIRQDKGSLIVFGSRNERWLEKEFWGMEDDKMSRFI